MLQIHILYDVGMILLILLLLVVVLAFTWMGSQRENVLLVINGLYHAHKIYPLMYYNIML